MDGSFSSGVCGGCGVCNEMKFGVWMVGGVVIVVDGNGVKVLFSVFVLNILLGILILKAIWIDEC